jgi:hypothetical protein
MAMMIHQPIPEAVGWVATPDGTAQVMPYQIVVMVSVNHKAFGPLGKIRPEVCGDGVC